MGQQMDSKYIAGVALGGLVFNYIYISLNFLRMGTTGLVAQNKGSENYVELEKNLITNVSLAILLGIIIIILCYPIMLVSSNIFNASYESENLMKEYISIRTFSAPAVLINMVFLGCFFGLGAPKSAMMQLIIICFLNAFLDIVFVFMFAMSIKGVALASVIAEYSGMIISSIVLWNLLKEKIRFSLIYQFKKIGLIRKNYSLVLTISKDLFVRTLLLVTAEAIIINKSASFGDDFLAATQVIFVFFAFISYGLDGFAHSAETLVGQAIGKKNKDELYKIIYNTLIVGFVFSIFISIIIYLFGFKFFQFISPIEEVIKINKDIFFIVVLLPLVGIWPFLMDGFFVGAADSKAMRNSTVLAFITFVLLINLFVINEQNIHLLWTIFLIYLLLRALFLCFYIKRVFLKAEKHYV